MSDLARAAVRLAPDGARGLALLFSLTFPCPIEHCWR
jgi:hypothetical protein